MYSAKIRGGRGRYVFAVIALLAITLIAAAGIPRGEQQSAAQSSGGMALARPAGDASSGNPGDAAWTAQHEKQSPVTIMLDGAQVRTDVKHDISPPLRDIPALPPGTTKRSREVENSLPPGTTRKLAKDPALQLLYSPLSMPPTIANFEGQYNYEGVIPPDTNGDVGPNHYVQTVNTTFQIYNKATGATVYGPVDINTLFRGFGGPCESQNDGDPITLYDQLADRWQISQFTAGPAPYYQCIAESASGDPAGAYYRYAFLTSPVNFEDYPHLGVWPDAYYMATNEFANGAANSGAGFFAFERSKMLVGQTARQIYYTRPIPEGGYLPSDLDGYRLPPANSPNFFMSPYRLTEDRVRMYKFQITTWDPVPVSALVGPIDITVDPWSTPSTIPQPGTSMRLDNLADRFMNRLAYRNFSDHQSLVVNHAVDAGSGRAGIRWYEFRDPNALMPIVYQQSTFAPPDGIWRWMGSVAMDGAGDLAAGYSASSSTVFPSIYYAGRLVNDPLNQLAQGEGSIINGGGSQTETAAGRWGDYSSMSVDVDDCTYWYTQEYYSVTGLRNWRTRFASFKFPNCTARPATPTATGTPATATPTSTRLSTATASPTACPGGISVTGSITNNDPTMTGRLARDGVPSTCAAPKAACPGAGDTQTRHYDAYTLTNTSGITQCVTVNISNSCGNNALLSAAYLGSFDPSNVCANYLADMGIAGPSFSYSFSVPAGANYVVTVLENSPNLGCATYHISISPCDTGPRPPTVTGTPPTATRTSTATRTATRTATATRTGTATATPCGQTSLLSEGFEAGTLGVFTATTSAGSSKWTTDNTVAHSGIFSAMVPDPDETADQQLTQRNSVLVPASASSAQMTFWHRFSFEDGTVPYDGGVLEYSTDNGANWTDAGSLITTGGYNGIILVGGGNPLSGQQGWVDVSTGYPAFTQVVVNLNSLKGQNVKFRFRMGSDSSGGADGWWVDDVSMTAQLGCTTGTVTTVPSTATRTRTIVAGTGTSTIAVPTRTRTSTVTRTRTGTVVAGTVTSTAVVPTGTRTAAVSTGTRTPTLAVSTGTRTSTAVVPTGSPTLVSASATRVRTSTVVVGTGTRTPTSIVSTSTRTSTVAVGTGTRTQTAVPTSIQTGTRVATSTRTQTAVPVGTQTGTVVVRPSSTRTATRQPATRTGTRVPASPSSTRTRTAIPVVSGTATSTPTECTLPFTDVPSTSIFYAYIKYMYCHGVISGYNSSPPCVAGGAPCFLPSNPTTRGQVSKIVTLAFGFPINTQGGPHFSDVHQTGQGSTFYPYIETLYNKGIISGYSGSQANRCTAVGLQAPCYLPDNPVSRGQIAKIVVNSAAQADPQHWQIQCPSTATFQDVPVGSTFFCYVETAYSHGILAGYCANGADSCPPGSPKVFKPGDNATRAQICKIVYLAVVYAPQR